MTGKNIRRAAMRPARTTHRLLAALLVTAALARSESDDWVDQFADCATLRIESMESRGAACLSVDSEATKNLTKTPTFHPSTVCEDRRVTGANKTTRPWHDGTNGCAAYEREETRGHGWCALYGAHPFPQGSAKQACCACGGGRNVTRAFGAGDDVEVKVQGGAWRAATVSTASPGGGSLYAVRVGNKQATVLSEATIRPRPPPRDGLALAPCDPGDAAARADLRWALVGASPENGSSLLASLRHVASGAMLSGKFPGEQPKGRAQVTSSLLYAGEPSQGDADAWGGSTLRVRSAFGGGAAAWRPWAEIIRKTGDRAREDCLIGGRFGQPGLSKAEWTKCDDHMFDGLPGKMWKLTCDAGDDFGGDGALARAASLLALPEASIRALAPWRALGVGRGADAKAVKQAFRELSRVLHPDKRALLQSKIPSASAANADALFDVAQRAYDGLKGTDEALREKFRLANEKDGGLFDGSVVAELRPSDLKEDRGDLAWNATNSTTLWIVMLYSPSCMMSRSIAPLVEAAAAAFREKDRGVAVKFGAYACGEHGDAKAKTNKKGFAGVFEDPVCASLEPGLSETPRFAAAVEGAASPSWDRWRDTFGRVSAPNFPRRLVAFADRAARLLAAARTVERVERPFDEPLANAVALYVDDATPLSAAVEIAFAAKARDVAAAGFRAVVADCAGWCADAGVAFAPQIRVYGPGGEFGLLDEAFEELRDAEVAIASVAATLAAVATPSDAVALDDADGFEADDAEAAGACGAAPDGAAADARLDAPDPLGLSPPRTTEPDMAPRGIGGAAPKLSPRSEQRRVGGGAGEPFRGNSALYGGGMARGGGGAIGR